MISKGFNSIKLGKFFKRFSVAVFSLFVISSIPVEAAPKKKQTPVGRQHHKVVHKAPAKKSPLHKAAPKKGPPAKGIVKKAVVPIKKSLAPVIKKALAPVIKKAVVPVKKTQPPKAQAPKAQAPKAQAPKIQTPKAQALKAQAPKIQTPKAQALKAQAPKIQTPKAQALKAQPPKIQTPTFQAPKAQAPKIQTPKAQALKAQAPKIQTPKAQALKAQAPKIQTPTVQAPKAQTPTVQAPKAEVPKVQTPKVQPSKIQAPKAPLARPLQEATRQQQAEKARLQQVAQARQQVEQARLKEVERARLQRVEQARLQEVEQARLQEVEQDRLQRVEQARLQEVEQARLQRVEQARLQVVEQARLQQVEQARLQQVQQDRIQQVEQARLQQVEQDPLQQVEQARLQQLEQYRQKTADLEQQLDPLITEWGRLMDLQEPQINNPRIQEIQQQVEFLGGEWSVQVPREMADPRTGDPRISEIMQRVRRRFEEIERKEKIVQTIPIAADIEQRLNLLYPEWQRLSPQLEAEQLNDEIKELGREIFYLMNDWDQRVLPYQNDPRIALILQGMNDRIAEMQRGHDRITAIENQEKAAEALLIAADIEQRLNPLYLEWQRLFPQLEAEELDNEILQNLTQIGRNVSYIKYDWDYYVVRFKKDPRFAEIIQRVENPIAEIDQQRRFLDAIWTAKDIEQKLDRHYRNYSDCLSELEEKPADEDLWNRSEELKEEMDALYEEWNTSVAQFQAHPSLTAIMERMDYRELERNQQLEAVKAIERAEYIKGDLEDFLTEWRNYLVPQDGVQINADDLMYMETTSNHQITELTGEWQMTIQPFQYHRIAPRIEQMNQQIIPILDELGQLKTQTHIYLETEPLLAKVAVLFEEWTQQIDLLTNGKTIAETFIKKIQQQINFVFDDFDRRVGLLEDRGIIDNGLSIAFNQKITSFLGKKREKIETLPLPIAQEVQNLGNEIMREEVAHVTKIENQAKTYIKEMYRQEKDLLTARNEQLARGHQLDHNRIADIYWQLSRLDKNGNEQMAALPLGVRRQLEPYYEKKKAKINAFDRGQETAQLWRALPPEIGQQINIIFEEMGQQSRSKEKFLNTPLHREEGVRSCINEDGDYDNRAFPICNLGYRYGDNPPRTDQYSLEEDLNTPNLPTAPVLHPLNIEDGLLKVLAPAFTLNVKLRDSKAEIPESIRANLMGIQPEDIDTFVIVQDMAWENVPLRLNPHYWLEPEAPAVSEDNYGIGNEDEEAAHTYTVQAGVFSKQFPDLRVEGQPLNDLVEAKGIRIHNSGPNTPLLSTGGVSIENLDTNISQILWSLTKYIDKETNIERAAVVQHILLNQKDEYEFEEALSNNRTLTKLKERLRVVKVMKNRFETVDLDEVF